MTLKRFSVAAIFVLAFAMPALAHHSHAQYNSEAEVTLAGTITEYHWINPHTWIYMDVEDEDGEVREWVIEGGGPGTLTRRGWSRDSFYPGERVTVTAHPSRDGSNGLLLGIVTKSNGEEYDGN